MVRGRRAERRLRTASTAIWRRAATRSRSSGKATTRRRHASITYRELHARGLPVRQRAASARRQEGRPRAPSTCR
ncbi:MAG: hypothetical protein MZV49_22880 [Rhodopseudomonas palustris]|nr:hypothetical protein [Rhodopseudomonas palustris]